MTKKINIGIIGCGNISGIYFENCRRFEVLNVVACADLVHAKAEAAAAQNSGVQACSVEGLLQNPDIDIVLNLTTPDAHAEVALAALEAGKNIHNEKPLTISREDGKKLLQLAAQKKLRVSCAPDTFLGGGHQTCRKLIDDGWIGKPIAATAFMLCHGHESWHPDPEFYYQTGGGPMFDMGPYYLTAMINLMGPIKRVGGATQITFPERTITSQPQLGKKVTVEVPTHVVGLMEFAAGAIGTIVTSFDVWAAEVPRIEIYGTEGSMSVPDPNYFDGPVRIFRMDKKEWVTAPLSHPHTHNSRGIGVADMAYGLISGRPHRTNGALAYHVLDVMHGFHDAAKQGKFVTLESNCERPAALPMGLREYTLDE